MKKRILSALLCLSLLIGLLPATVLTAVAEDAVPAYTLDNGYIRVSVSKKNGGFAVSTVEGDKLKKSDNNKTLLYHNGQYDTSFLSLRIGEGEEAKDYLFGGKYDGSSGVSVSQPIEGGNVVATWSLGDLTFYETISLATEASNEHGFVSVSLAVLNTGAPVSVKARLLYDTYLGSRDYGYYRIPDERSNLLTVKTETVLEQSETYTLPQNFYAVDNESDPQITAYSVNTVLPYKAAFGHWNHLASTLFDFSPLSTLDFTGTRNEYLTADSAYALYFDLGTVPSNETRAFSTYYGLYSHSALPSSTAMAIDLTVPVRLELNGTRDDFVPLISKGSADFSVAVNFTNYVSETASDYKNIALAVTTTSNLRALSDEGAAVPGFDFADTEPFCVNYSDMKIGDTLSKTLYFEANPVTDAAYERITIGVYDTSKTGGAVSESYKLGERTAYILLPGNDGDIPKVSFTSMSPRILYNEGTRHLFVTVTNPAMLDNRANWNLFAYTDNEKTRTRIPHEAITVNDGVMDVVLDDETKLAEKTYKLYLEWTDAAVSAGIVPEEGKRQSSPLLTFVISNDIKYKNDSYGILAVVETTKASYEILTFKTESDFEDYRKDTSKYVEILITLRGEFSRTKAVTQKNGNKLGTYYTAASKKTFNEETRTYSVDNPVVINDCIDFEGGSVAVYYEDYDNYPGFVKSPICVEFDGELYTSVERSPIYKGKSIFTKLEQGKSYSLVPYDENGARIDPDNFTDETVTLVWNSAAGIGQTLAGMIFKLAYGTLGTMKVEVEHTTVVDGETKKFTETKQCGVVSFSASLDLSFTGAAGKDEEPGTQKDTYWSKMKDLWAFYREDTSLYQYAYNQGRIERMLDWSKIDEHSEENDGKKAVNASVMVPDVLFGCGEGFVGVHFKVKVGLKNFVSALPTIEGEIEVNTINNWAFGVEGKVELAKFALEVKLSFKSHNDIPVPDQIYFFVSGFRPGINLDGCGIVWLTGAGGGIENLYDTIFLSQAVPPLKLVLSAAFNVVQVMECEKATLAVGLTGISIKAEKLSILGIKALTVIDKMGLSLEWYPGIDLRANIVVNLFEGLIYGGGYIVLLSPDYKDVFFEMFARAQVRVPGSVPIVGGMVLAGVDLGISTEKIWGALEVLFIKLGITYYWGEGSVDFGSGGKTQPTYPELLGYEDIPVYYDSEGDRTLYARFGTNTALCATNMPSDGLVLMAGGARVRSNEAKNTHIVNFGPFNSGNSALLQITYPAADLEDAKAKAQSFTVGASAGANDYGIVLYNGENLSSANANVTFDEESGKATFAFTATENAVYDKDWHIATCDGAQLYLYNVDLPPELTSVSGSISGGNITLSWDGEKLSDLDSLSFYLCESTDVENGTPGYPIIVTEENLDKKTLTAALPENIPDGKYFVRCVYAKTDEVNGICHSADTLSYVNPMTPAAAVLEKAGPDGNLEFSVTVAATDDPNTDGYLVTVYEEDGTETDFSGIRSDKAESGATVLSAGGTYTSVDPEGNSLTVGLVPGKRYILGVTPYHIAGENAAVFGKEVRTSVLTLPAMTTPTVKITANATAHMRTETQNTPGGAPVTIEKTVYATSDLTFTAAISEKSSGIYRLDSGDDVAFSLTDSLSVPFKSVSDGEHTLTIEGRDEEGDRFRHVYTFTVDTLPPKLLISSPVNGSFFGKDGKVTLTGITDPDARFTVTSDGAVIFADTPIKNIGSYDGDTGLFTLDLTLPDPQSALSRKLFIAAGDDVGNTEAQEIMLTHGGVKDLTSVKILADDTLVGGGNLAVPSEGLRASLSLVGLDGEGNAFLIDSDNVSFELIAVNGNASLENGILTAEKYAQGIVTGRFAVTDNAFRTDTLVFGAEETMPEGLVLVSTTLGGSAEGGGTYRPGDTVTLTAKAQKGYEFVGWTISGATVSDLSSETVTFSMPDSGNVSAKASFKAIPTGGGGASYPIGGGDTTKPSTSGGVKASAGETVRVKLPTGLSEKDYLPWYYVGENRVFVPISDVIDGYVTFIAPIDTTYYFRGNTAYFDDTVNHWGRDFAEFCALRDLFRGVSENEFCPDGTMTRAMFITILYRLSASPAVTAKSGFADVSNDAWYADAVSWAKQSGVVEGYSEELFGPQNPVTREQMCVLLNRYLTLCGYTLSGDNTAVFTDEDAISDWALEAVRFGAKTGLVTGLPDGRFAPKEHATRAQNATVFRRMIGNILGKK